MLKKIDKPLLIISFALFVFGLIMILSASSMESYMRYDASPYHYFIRQAIFLGVGFVAFIFVIFFPTKNYKPLANILIIIISLILFALTLWGYSANSAQSWFSIGPFNIQPSEFTKVIIIIYLAIYYEKHKNELDNPWILIKPILFCIVIAALVAIQPDLGTAGIVVFMSLIIFYSLPMSKKAKSTFNKLFLVIILVFLAVLVTTKGSFLKDYQLQRFNFLDPCDRYQEESGYQLCNSFIAFKNGGLTGQGVGESTQKYLYLPESYTDFIFPIIVEEWGLIVGILIIVLLFVVLYRLLKIATHAPNIRCSLIAYGVFSYVFLHIAINLIGVMGLGPLTGVPLPFFSYGGSYALSLCIALGLAQRVAIESNAVKKSKKLKKK